MNDDLAIGAAANPRGRTEISDQAVRARSRTNHGRFGRGTGVAQSTCDQAASHGDVRMNDQKIANPKPLSEAEVTTWSAITQLSFLFDFLIPFSSLVINTVIYNVLGARDSRVRHNARVTLNFKLSFLVYFVAASAVLVGGFLLLTRKDPEPWVFGILLALPSAAFLIFSIFYTFVTTVMNAIVVLNGNLAHYRFTLNFIKSDRESSTANAPDQVAIDAQSIGAF